MKRSRSRARLFLVLSILGSFLFSLEATGSADAPEAEGAEMSKTPPDGRHFSRGDE